MKDAGIEEVEALKRIAELYMKWKKDAENHTVEQLLEKIMSESNLLSYYFEREGGSSEELNALKSFFNYFRRQNRNNPAMSLSDVMNDLSLLQENKMGIEETKLKSQQDGVQLMTAHGSKGLEFNHIFLFKCVDSNWGGRSEKISDKASN